MATFKPTTTRHPAHWRRKTSASTSTTKRRKAAVPIAIPTDRKDVTIEIEGRTVQLTNLNKLFWKERGITKGDLLRYYAEVAPALLPHLAGRAMVMKRYPDGAEGKFFFMKHSPESRPDWVSICSIEHSSGNVIDFAIVQDLPSLLWVVNLGCIDLNQWYARCDDVDRPDFLHFDLDPSEGGTFAQVREAALAVHAALDALKMPNFAKTTGSRGIHVYVPIERGPNQKQVWAFAKQFAIDIASLYPKLLTSEYRIANRPRRRILVDYNQNAWGRTLASVYSVRPKPLATVSTPVTWKEVEDEIRMEDFRIDNVPARIQQLGDLWKPLLASRRRFRLESLGLKQVS